MLFCSSCVSGYGCYFMLYAVMVVLLVAYGRLLRCMRDRQGARTRPLPLPISYLVTNASNPQESEPLMIASYPYPA